MGNGWTPERRAKQAELIKQWMPWKQSTGPKSIEGEARVAANAWTGGQRAQLRALTKMVNDELKAARDLVSGCR